MIKGVLLAAMLVGSVQAGATLTYHGASAAGGGGFDQRIYLYRPGLLDVTISFAGPTPGLDQYEAAVDVRDRYTEDYCRHGPGGPCYDDYEYDFIKPFTLDPSTGDYVSKGNDIAGKDFFVNAEYWATEYANAYAGFTNTAAERFTVTFSGSSTVPEPSSWSMLVCGFGFIGTFARRRGMRLAPK